jgi:putative nucleotidyltransferase-like protein
MDNRLEFDVLFYCLGIGTNKIKSVRLDQLPSSEWEDIICQSDRNGVAPLLYMRLKALSQKTTIPDSVLKKLRKKYVYTAWKNKQLNHELSQMLSLLNNHGIPVIVIKGAALAELLYQNIALRPMNDVDLVVKKKDLQKIDKILSSSEFSNTTQSLHSKRKNKWVPIITYMNRVKSFDLHTRLFELPKHNPWENAAPASVASTDTLILGLEDFFLHLCLHVHRHLYMVGITKLIWWYDIAEWIKLYRKKLDWEYMVGIAQKYNVEADIHRILHVVNEWFGGHVPLKALSRFKSNGKTISILDAFYPAKNSKAVHKKIQTQYRQLDLFLSSFSTIPSVRNKIYHFLRTIFPSRTYMIHFYSIKQPSYVYFYYLVRISKATIKAICQLPKYLFNKFVSQRA